MAKAQSVFHAPTGVWISPGTAGFELVGKPREKHMAELDAKYRETSGLPSKKIADKASRLTKRICEEVAIEMSICQDAVSEITLDTDDDAQTVALAIRNAIVDNGTYYEVVKSREKVASPYHLKSIGFSTNANDGIPNHEKRLNTVEYTPFVIDLFDKNYPLEVPKVFIFHGGEDWRKYYLGAAAQACLCWTLRAYADTINASGKTVVITINPREEQQ